MGIANIYELVDPRYPNIIRYIGKTEKDIQERLDEHIRGSKYYCFYISNWIKSLSEKNIIPIIKLIDQVPLNEWRFWERHYISLYRSWGFNLTNLTDGGEGVTDPTGEIAKKRGISRRGKKNKKIVSQETRDKLRLGRLGKKASLESRKRMSQAQKLVDRSMSLEKRLILSEIGKANPSLGFKGKTHSKESIEKMSIALKGKKLSSEHIENIRKCRTGCKLSQETKNKISTSHKNRIKNAQ